MKVFSASEVNLETNVFTVYGENGRFNWLVNGKCGNIGVEPIRVILMLAETGHTNISFEKFIILLFFILLFLLLYFFYISQV